MGYGIDPPTAPVTRIALLAALVDGDLDTAYRIATKLLDEGVSFEAVAEEVLGPVQRELGVRWANGDLTVADEHAATSAAEGLVMLLAGGISAPEGPLVMVACPEGDAHSLPARIVSAVLALRGFRSVLLGASLPARDLADYLERQEPFAVALSISMPAALYRAAASVAVAHVSDVPVVVGGRAVRDDEPLAWGLGVDAWADTAEYAADVLGGWRTQPPRPLAPAIEVPEECFAIDVHRAALLAAAIPPDEPGAGRDLVDEVGRLLDVAQGALLLDDRSLFTRQVETLGGVENGQQTTPATLDRVLERLIAATSEPLPATAELLRGSTARR
jgi:methanogenic corrinoid protein MtbC1